MANSWPDKFKWLDDWPNERVNEWTYEWMNECKNATMKELTYKLMSECLWIYYSFKWLTK